MKCKEYKPEIKSVKGKSLWLPEESSEEMFLRSKEKVQDFSDITVKKMGVWRSTETTLKNILTHKSKSFPNT